MIEIDSLAPLKTLRAKTPNPVRDNKVLKRTIEDYKAAYKAVYRITPTVTVEGKWISIVGHPYRVTRKRLREMVIQLEYRAGVRD